MKKVLIAIDLQNDFIDEALGTKEAVDIVEACVQKIRSYQGDFVFATMDTHAENYLETVEGKHLPIVHCVKSTHGWQLNDRIQEALQEVDATIIEKPTFGSEQLVKEIKKLAETEPLEIEIIGLCTDICVVSNALLLKAALYETPIYVDPSCCAGVTPESHQAALTTMKMCQIDLR